MSPQISRTNPKAKNTVAVVLIVLVVGIVASAKAFKGPFENGQILGLNSTYNFDFKSKGLAKIIQHDLPSDNGEYAVYIKDLSGSQNYSLNSNVQFPAASLYKLYLMTAVLKEASSSAIT